MKLVVGGTYWASPFSIAFKENYIDYKTLRDPDAGFLVAGRLVVKLEIRDLRVYNVPLTNTKGDDMRLITVEVIANNTLETRSNQSKAFGIVSIRRKRSDIVLHNIIIQRFMSQVHIAVFSHECRRPICFPEQESSSLVV